MVYTVFLYEYVLPKDNAWWINLEMKYQLFLFFSSGGAIMVTSSYTALENSPLLTSRPGKRKLPDYDVWEESPKKRVSPFLNTPKQRRDDRRKILRLSMQKLKAIDDPEVFLCRSVLINNTVRRLNREMKEEKRYGYGICGHAVKVVRQDSKPTTPSFNPAKRRNGCEYDVMNNNDVIDPSYTSGVAEETEKADKITDDMSDALVKTVSGLGTDAEEPMAVDAAGHLDVVEQPTETSTSGHVTVSNYSSNLLSETSCGTSSSSSECNKLTERDRQILGEMDIVFNKLINVLSEVVATCWPPPTGSCDSLCDVITYSCEVELWYNAGWINYVVMEFELPTLLECSPAYQ